MRMGIFTKAKVAIFGWPKNILEGAEKWERSPEEYAEAVISNDKLGLEPGQLIFRADGLIAQADDDGENGGTPPLAIISVGGEGESFGSVGDAIGEQRDRLTRHRGSVASAIGHIFDLLNR